MKDTISENQTIVSRSGSIVAQVLRMFSRILIMLVVGCTLSVFIEVVGVTFVWPHLGAGKSIDMVAAEMRHLGHIAERNPFLHGMDNFVVENLAALKSAVVTVGLGGSFFAAKIMLYFEVILNMVNVFFLRVSVMLFSFPVYLFCGFIGITRGLVNRELRKWGGGRESSGQFHLFINMVPLGFTTSWLVYLSCPWTLNPNYIVMPFACFFGYTLMLSSYRIKKYI